MGSDFNRLRCESFESSTLFFEIGGLQSFLTASEALRLMVFISSLCGRAKRSTR